MMEKIKIDQFLNKSQNKNQSMCLKNRDKKVYKNYVKENIQEIDLVLWKKQEKSQNKIKIKNCQKPNNSFEQLKTLLQSHRFLDLRIQWQHNNNISMYNHLFEMI